MRIRNLILVSVPFLSFGQKVSINSIEDSRSTGDSYFSNRCKVELRISGEEARKYAFARLGSLEKAVDDRGNDLLREEDSFSSDYQKKEETYFTVAVDLLNPSRKSETIADISGKVILFSPTEANGGKVIVRKFASKPGVNLLPASVPVGVSYMNKESVMKYNKEDEQKKEEELAKLPAEIASGMRDLIDAFSGLFGGGDTENTVYFMITGDPDKLVSLKFLDGDGNELENSGYTKSGNILGYFMSGPAQTDWGIELSIETAESIKELPFSIKGAELP